MSIRKPNGDLDFSRVQLKANASGSWMNVLTCDTSRMDEVRAACQVLMRSTFQRLKFKFLDAEGNELEMIEFK